MARPRPEKKRERKAKPNGQLPLPTPRAPASSSAIRVLPMQLRVGDSLADETGEWQVVGQPYTTAGGKTAYVRVQRVGQPDVTDLRTWGAHERVSVKRTASPPSALGSTRSC